MSITVSYRRILPEKFAKLQDNPESAEEFFYPEHSTTIALMDRLMLAQIQNNRELMQQLLVQLQEALYRDKTSIYTGNLDPTRTRLSIEKEWQAIHYLLTGEIAFDKSKAEPPLSNLIFGGNPTEFKATYGYVRYLSPDEVKELAQALHQVSSEELRARFDARGDTEIYAQEDKWDEEAWKLLLRVMDSLVRFFDKASINDEAILISSD